MTSGIYGIEDQDTGQIVYVGRAVDIAGRFSSHLGDAIAEARCAMSRGWIDYPVIRTKRNCLAYLWLEGVPFAPIVVEDIPLPAEQPDRERYWAYVLTMDGHPLSNGTTAGPGLVHAGHHIKKNPCPYTVCLEPILAGTLLHRPWWLASSKAIIPISSLPMHTKLRKDRPDLHAQVLAGELSPHAAMVEAGFRKRTITVPLEPGAAATLRRHCSAILPASRSSVPAGAARASD